MNNLKVFYYYFLVALTFHQARASRSNALRLEVSNHQLTLLPSDTKVTVNPLNECENVNGFRRCEGELSGRSYTWAQENQDTNYVLFTLSRRANIREICLTYRVDSTSEKPKVSFCAAPSDTVIGNTFPNVTCDEVMIEATGNENRTAVVDMPFPNTTNSIAMEVITQGIKAAFTATSVQIFGTYEAVETTSSPVAVTSGAVISSDNQSERISNDTTSGVPSPVQTSSITMSCIIILCLALGLQLL